MRDGRVGSVIVTSENEPVGIVTDRDVTVEVAPEGRDPEDVRVESVMTRDLHTIDRDAGVFDLVETMAEHAVRRMPVVDSGDLYGIVTFHDLNRLLWEEQSNLARIIEAESPRY